jgi:hypothetical protein
LAIQKPIGMAEIKVHCAFVKGGTRSLVWIGATMYIFGQYVQEAVLERFLRKGLT